MTVLMCAGIRTILRPPPLFNKNQLSQITDGVDDDKLMMMRMMMRCEKVGSSGENRRWRQEETILTGFATGSTTIPVCILYSV